LKGRHEDAGRQTRPLAAAAEQEGIAALGAGTVVAVGPDATDHGTVHVTTTGPPQVSLPPDALTLKAVDAGSTRWASLVDQYTYVISPEAAAEMAAGARSRLGAHVGIAVTGIAGPDGGTPEKPVGLVFIHVETPEVSRGIEFTFAQDRESVRRRSTVVALHLARRLLTRSPDGEA